MTIHPAAEITQSRLPFSTVADAVLTELSRVLGERDNIFFFLTGLNGSGKTTFKLQFLNSFPFVSYDTIVHPILKDRTNPDEYIKDINLDIVNRMERRLRSYLELDEDVVIFEEASIGLSVYRAHFIYLARQQGYKTILLYFPIDKVLAHERNKLRSLGMTQDGQIRLPEIIIDTLCTYQNTQFRVKSQAEVPSLAKVDSASLPYLVSRLSAEEQAVINEAFFRFPTLRPLREDVKSHLEEHDYFDEIWTLGSHALSVSL